MILTQLNLSTDETSKRKTLLVPVPQWGEDAEVMVTEMTVAGFIRRSNLTRKVLEMKDLPDIRKTGLLMCSDLLSVMVHPETGDFLLEEEQLEQFYAAVNKESLEALLAANGELNPIKEYRTLDAKKKNS